MISVIVPVYKAEKYLHRCVDSILAQSYTDFELLLIDDGSPDRSGDICDEYVKKDSRVRVFHKENGGVSSARNMGLDNAKGEWISFVDSDDWIESHYFASFMASCDADWVLGGYVETLGNSTYIADELYQGRDIIGFCNTYNGVHILRACWGGLYKTSIIEDNQLRFSTKLRYAEDTVFNLNYLTYCKCVRTMNALGYIYCNDVICDDKYLLSKDEIHQTLNEILRLHKILEAKYKNKIVNDADAQIFLNKYPLDTIETRSTLLEYSSLCFKCYPEISSENLYSDSRCSPIIRVIITIKKMYENHEKYHAHKYIILASRISNYIQECPKFQYYDFYIWYFLLKYRKYVLLIFLMNSYFLLKKLLK